MSWKNYTLGVIILLVSMGSASAQMPPCHVGAQTGLAIASATISAPSLPASLDGLGARSRQPDFGVHAGCDFRLTGSPIVIGAWGEYTWRDTSFQVSLPFGSFSAGLGDGWAFGGRAGYDMGGVMPYVLLGYTQSDMNYSLPLTGVPNALRGWTYGGGVEMPIKGTMMSLALETRYTKFNETELVAGLANIKADQISGMVRLNLNFGGK